LTRGLSLFLLAELVDYLSGHERLVLLCGIRQSFTLAGDFNHLSGLKFLIKRVLASPRAINLYQLSAICGGMHSLETLRICAMQKNSFNILLPRKQQYESRLQSDIFSASSAAFFVEYFRVWMDSLIAECFGRAPGSTLPEQFQQRQTDTEDVDGGQGKETNGLVEVTLPNDLSSRPLSSSSVLLATLKCLIDEEILQNCLTQVEEWKTVTTSFGDLEAPSSRKNPFRESVVPSAELPSDCAVELQAAIEEVWDFFNSNLRFFLMKFRIFLAG
jgi:hypothetical protein